MASLVSVNRKRAQLLAELMSKRLDNPFDWAGYRRDEELIGELRFADMLVYRRKQFPNAVLIFRQPQMVNIVDVDWGDPIVIESHVSERVVKTLRIKEGVHYSDGLTHTFSTTRSLEEQAKVGAELAMRAAIEGEYSGVKASFEVSAKITAEYSRRWGSSTTQTDTVHTDFTTEGPIEIRYEAVRSLDKVRRHIKANTDFDYSAIELQDFLGAGALPPRLQEFWAGMTELRSVMKGEAPANRMVNDVMQPTSLYAAFIANPLMPAEEMGLDLPTEGIVEFDVEYDNVNNQTIDIL